MRTINKWTLFVIIAGLSLYTGKVNAQVTAARAAMQSLYTVYDSMPYITFDIKYTYSSDTLYNDYSHDEMKGTYTMSGKKAKFTIGDIEYMQNDSFFIAVDHNDKSIIVSNSRQANAGGYMPLRGAIDSLLYAYEAHYTINVQDNEGDSLGSINFLALDSIAQFNNFNITFDREMHFITSMTYDFYEHRGVSDSIIINSPNDLLRRSTLKIEFITYRFDNFSESVYDENNYIWFEDGVCKPVAKLEGYKVYDARQ